MKKIFIAALSLFLATSCSNNVDFFSPKYGDTDNNITCYLNLTPTGLIDGVKGEENDTVKLDYSYTFVAKAGDPLPDETRITNSQSGITFGGWYVYEEKTNPGVPTIYETVPNQDGVILQAFWNSENTPTPGGGGGGDTPITGNTIYLDVSGISWWANGNAATYYYCWDASGTPTVGSWPGTQTTTKVGNYYSLTVPATSQNIIINRVNPSVLPTAEGAVWNQTVDIALQSGKNLLSLSDGKDGLGKLNNYTWSTYNA